MTKPAVLLVSRLPEPLAGRLRERFDCHALADVDAAGLQALAASVDFLVVCASGGADTRALVNADVLAALGPAGVLVNIARGSIVDEDALITALRERQILAAGLDVFCHEPHVPPALLALDNVVLTPHMASTTGATVQAMFELTFANLAAHFDALPVPTPVA